MTKWLPSLRPHHTFFFPVLDPPRNLPLDFAHHPDLLKRLHLEHSISYYRALHLGGPSAPLALFQQGVTNQWSRLP